MAKLFSMVEKLHKNNITVILVQIDEAHSEAWPMAIDVLLNMEQPKPQQTFSDRVERANYFVENYGCPYKVYIDNWDNDFAETFRSWPDNYYLINDKMKVIGKSEYHLDLDKEATIILDCTELLEKLL